MTADELNLETRDPFICCDWIIVSCSLIKSQTETVEMEVFIVPEKKRNNRQKYTHVILKKKNPICLWIKVESPSPSFTKIDTIAVGCFIGFQSLLFHTPLLKILSILHFKCVIIILFCQSYRFSRPSYLWCENHKLIWSSKGLGSKVGQERWVIHCSL